MMYTWQTTFKKSIFRLLIKFVIVFITKLPLSFLYNFTQIQQPSSHHLIIPQYPN